jgi:hypothetical protein
MGLLCSFSFLGAFLWQSLACAGSARSTMPIGAAKASATTYTVGTCAL